MSLAIRSTPSATALGATSYPRPTAPTSTSVWKTTGASRLSSTNSRSNRCKRPAPDRPMLFAYEADIIPLVRTQRGTIEERRLQDLPEHPSQHPPGLWNRPLQRSVFLQSDARRLPTAPSAPASSASPPPGQGNHECGPRENVTQEAPIRDARVRHAMNLAINRNEINNVFYQGLGFPLVDYFPPWRDDFKEEWTPFPGPNGSRPAPLAAGRTPATETPLRLGPSWLTPAIPTASRLPSTAS